MSFLSIAENWYKKSQEYQGFFLFKFFNNPTHEYTHTHTCKSQSIWCDICKLAFYVIIPYQSNLQCVLNLLYRYSGPSIALADFVPRDATEAPTTSINIRNLMRALLFQQGTIAKDSDEINWANWAPPRGTTWHSASSMREGEEERKHGSYPPLI